MSLLTETPNFDDMLKTLPPILKGTGNVDAVIDALCSVAYGVGVRDACRRIHEERIEGGDKAAAICETVLNVESRIALQRLMDRAVDLINSLGPGDARHQ